MKELIKELKSLQPSSDDYVALTLIKLATFCDKLSDEHEALVDRLVDNARDVRSDIRRLKNDVEGMEQTINSLQVGVSQLERDR